MDTQNGRDALFTLAQFKGHSPIAPVWFDKAVSLPVTQQACEWEGAPLELLCWGELGKPGLLLLHGNNAHARWWSPIAAALSAQYRVAALSWSGMGGSRWRSSYSIECYAQEAMFAARVAGLFKSGPPVFVGHSLGASPVLEAASLHGNELAGAIILDSPIYPGIAKPVLPRRKGRRIYPTLALALARFRLAPPQPCENVYYLDWIARHSLCAVEDGENAGWTWRIDPELWDLLLWHDKWDAFTNARCPLALVRGDKSRLVTAEQFQAIHAMSPAALIDTIAGAGHHVMLDQPHAVIQALDRLASRLRAQGQDFCGCRP